MLQALARVREEFPAKQPNNSILLISVINELVSFPGTGIFL
jgi:hypothetical protein